MEYSHGSFCIAVPDTGGDASVLVFVAPQEQCRCVVSVRFYATGEDPEQALARVCRERGPARFETIESGGFPCGLSGTIYQVNRLAAATGPTMRELHVCGKLGQLIVHATATVGEADFQVLEPQVRSVLSSMRPAQ
jgi:hypothetical protein